MVGTMVVTLKEKETIQMSSFEREAWNHGDSKREGNHPDVVI
jgi:hypothetical protein